MNPTMRARIRCGDADAFAQAFDDHAQAVYRHAVRTDGTVEGAEDVVSLTFLEAWRSRGSLRPDGDSLRPWLLGIATNVLRNRRRAARRHRAALMRLPVADSVADFADDVASRMDDQGRLAVAAGALQRLRRTEREVFMLCVGSQLDYAAAAEALGIPVGTVRSRLSRARSKLRAQMEPAARAGQMKGMRTAQEDLP